MSLAVEEYLMIGDDIRIVFLGGSGKNIRIMIDAPKEVDIIRSKVIEKQMKDSPMSESLPKFYAEKEHPEKYKKKPKAMNKGNNMRSR